MIHVKHETWLVLCDPSAFHVKQGPQSEEQISGDRIDEQ